MADVNLPLISESFVEKGLKVASANHLYNSNVSGENDAPLERTGNIWTASGHIITAVIGSGVLSLSWCMAQLGWVAGVTAIFIFSAVTYYASTLLAECYRSDDPVFGKRNSTYTTAVRSILGKRQVWICGLVQYMIMYGATIGYTITAALSMKAIARSYFYQQTDDHSVPHFLTYILTFFFGVVEILLSQIRNFDRAWWLSIVAAIMSFSYATIGISLSLLEAVENGEIKGSLWGANSEALGSPTEKVWHVFRALGDIAFAFSYSAVLIEIQDTLKSPPENITMKKASFCGGSVTTFFYILCACFGYAAFGDNAPGNLLTSSEFHGKHWLVNLANLCILIHLLGAYQVYSQPIFAVVEEWLFSSHQHCDSVSVKCENKVYKPVHSPKKITIFRVVWRTAFVFSTTAISIIFPFFNDVLGLIGATNFWPLTVYFPVEMYIMNMKIKRWCKTWIFLRILSFVCLLVSLVAISGAIEGFIEGFRSTELKTKWAC